MDMGIKDLRVLVTAGANGIGLAIARAFMAEGARVHVCDVDEHGLTRLKSTDPGISTTVADVSDRDAVQRLFDDALAALGGLDVLVNNAGIAGPTAAVEDLSPEEWDRTLNINITGQFNCVRLAVAPLRESANASIVNLSSAAGKFGFPLRSPYSASKWAVVGLTKTLALELGPKGIRVNAVLPGVVEGERVRSVIENKAKARGIGVEAMQDELLAGTALRTTVTAEQVADQIVFLCSPRGRTISGQAISVDGGLVALA